MLIVSNSGIKQVYLKNWEKWQEAIVQYGTSLTTRSLKVMEILKSDQTGISITEFATLLLYIQVLI